MFPVCYPMFKYAFEISLYQEDFIIFKITLDKIHLKYKYVIIIIY